ncbi:MAG: hypothetical protein ACK5GV_03495 [Bacteroidota bacterium]|jgi:hypothetical protein
MKLQGTKLILIAGLLVYIPLACKKNEFTTKPQISFKKISNTTLSTTNPVVFFEIKFTDKEGDVQDTLWVQKISKVCPNSPGVQFTSKNKVPDFTPISNVEGVLEIGFAYNANIGNYPTISGCGNKTDTATFKFWLRDKAKNVSDTLVSPPIILLK